jgi:hypothetical protein
VQLNYIFYGTYKMDIRCKQFFDSVQDRFPSWPEFRDLTDERMICARDGIEQYVMTRIGEYAFKSVLDTEGDELLMRRMKLLSFVKPEVSLHFWRALLAVSVCAVLVVAILSARRCSTAFETHSIRSISASYTPLYPLRNTLSFYITFMHCAEPSYC